MMPDDPKDEGAMVDPRRSRLISTDDLPPRNSPPPAGSFSIFAVAARRGAVMGLGVGLLASGVALAVVWRCLPFYITYPPLPWPWYCTEPAYSVLAYLAFPVNLITADLAQAVRFAPLSWLFYTGLGALIGAALRWLRRRRTNRI